MGRQHGLRTLHVGIGRQDAVGIALGPLEPGLLEQAELSVDRVDRLANPEPQVGGHLVVATAGGVQLASDIPQAVGERPLDVHVDVFQLDVEGKLALLNFLADVA